MCIDNLGNLVDCVICFKKSYHVKLMCCSRNLIAMRQWHRKTVCTSFTQKVFCRNFKFFSWLQYFIYTYTAIHFLAFLPLLHFFEICYPLHLFSISSFLINLSILLPVYYSKHFVNRLKPSFSSWAKFLDKLSASSKQIKGTVSWNSVSTETIDV
jgi:hypothetical protein